jgi:ATP-binding cassette subfamily C protein
MKNQLITFKTIFTLIYKNRSKLFVGQLITLVAILISIPIPLMLPIMVDEVLLNKPDKIVHTIDNLFGSGEAFYYIFIVTITVVVLRFIHFLLLALITKIFTQISKNVTYDIRKKLLHHLQFVSMNEYETLGSGTISTNLVTDINTLDSFIITSASKFVSSVLTLIAISVVMIYIDTILGLLILVIQPLIIFISKKLSSNIKKLKKDENNAIETFQNNINETLDLFGQIKSSNKESYFIQQSINDAKNILDRSNEYSYKSVAYERFSYTLFLIAFEVLRASGLLLVAYSDLSIGLMFAMFGYIWFIMTPIQDILSMQYSYSSAKGALERINKILSLQKESNSNIILNKDNIDINIKNLSFSYTKDKQALKNISMKINAKQHIALIGSSGSGKTTLAQIIAGFYEKRSGELLYNNINVEKINKQSLRDNIFLILQMPILFNQTLKFNLTMGDESISNTQIYNALKIAQLDQVINNMPKKLDTVVGKHGIRLSGGQRQRISIARMILANPSVVIFDESTSALDVHTEHKLFCALKEFLKDKTVITIAHRLSTVQNAHMIYVLEDGKIVQEGTHKQLEFQDGHYNDFIKDQLI